VAPTRLHGLFVAIAAGFVLLTNLGGPTLWDDDEPKNSACSIAMLDSGDWVVPTFNGRLRIEKPPLVNWLQIAGAWACGRNEAGMRIGSALLTLATCLITWRIGGLLLGPTAGLLGGLSMATCVWTAVAGRAATPDAGLLFCTTLSIWLFVRGTPAGWRGESFAISPLTACGIGAACGAAMLAKGPVGLVLPLAAISGFALWTEAAAGWRSWLTAIVRLRLPLLLAAAVVVALPWHAWVAWRTDGEWLRGFFLVHNIGRFSGTMEGHSGSPLYYPAMIAIGFFPWSIVLLAMLAHAMAVLRGPVIDGTRRPMQLLVVWAAVWIGAFSCSGTKLPGYVWPAYPALAILCGAFLDGWLRKDTACVSWCRDPDRALGLVMRVAWTVLAVAGLAVAVGLPVAARLRAPGEEWLGLFGLIPLAGAVSAWRSQTSGMPARSLAAVAVSACLFVGLLASVAADRFSRVQGMRSFTTGLDAGMDNAERSNWACYWNVPPSLVFYARSSVAKLDTPEDVARHLASHHRPRLLVDSRHEPQVTDAIPPGCGVIARIPTLADHHYVVIGPLPTEGVALVRDD